MPVDPQALEALAVFPLPNVVLLPGGLLPLHIFEPRYRQMTADTLRENGGSGLIAMARLQAGYEDDYHARPPVHSVAGAGQIVDARELEDGRYHLLLRGVARVDVSDELPADKSYRRARAIFLDGDSTEHPELLKPYHDQLLSMCDLIADVIGDGGAQLRQLVRTVETPSELADVLSSALLSDPDLRQQMLETLDVADRLDFLMTQVGQVVATMSPDRGNLN